MTAPTFRRSNGLRPGSSTLSVVEATVEDSPNYYDGEIESLCAKMNALTILVGALIGNLPADQQKEFVSTHCYGWEAE